MNSENMPLFNRNFIIMAIATVCMFISFYLLMPIIAQYLIVEYNASPSLAGVVVASYIIIALLMRPFSGFLVDTFNRRRFYHLTYFLFTMVVSGYIFANSIALVFVIEVLLGALFALVTTAANTLVIDVMPSSRRREGIGYYGAITVFAMAVGPMLGLHLITHFTYQVLFIIAFAFCLLGWIIALFVKAKSREKQEKSSLSFDRFYLKAGTSTALIVAVVYYFYGSLVTFMPLYLNEKAIDVKSSTFFLFFSVGVIVSRVMAGKFLNRGLSSKLLQVGLTILVMAAALFIFLLTEYTFVPASLLMGLGIGFITPAIQTMIIDLVPANRRGTANSTYFIALDTGSGLGMLAGGFVADWFSYTFMYGVGWVLIILGFVLYKMYSQRDYAEKLRQAKEGRGLAS